jgi:hypothetical protein
MGKEGEGSIREKRVCREKGKEERKGHAGRGTKTEQKGGRGRSQVGSEGVLKKWGQRSLGTRKERYM